MEQEGRTVIVCGVPTDIEEKRLTDKLCIHFLRKRHGGGEISSITLPKSMAGCALITFEDSEVAQRVIQYGKHILSVDDKKFELTVSLFSKEVDPDEVFVCIAVTVDYSRLPLGKVAVSSLMQSFPDVRFSFRPREEVCDIKGRYSDVQALIASLLNLIDPQTSAVTHQPEGTEDRVDALSLREKNSSAIGLGYLSENSETHMDNEYTGQVLGQDLKNLGNSESSHHPDQALEKYREEEDGAFSLVQEAPLEEFFLVMDSDIYRYLQQHCGKQYQQILDEHKVEAVDVCSQDITTIYLQAKAGYPGQELKRVRRVHDELGWLYQLKETLLRKEQLPKEGISTEGLQQAFQALQQRLPEILLSDDKMNIYIVGSGGDVSEAKQFLLDMQGKEGGSTRGRGDYPRPLVANERDSLFLPPTTASPTVSVGSIIDARETDTVHKPSRKSKVEAGKEYRLAARFMEAGGKTSAGNEMGFVMGDTIAPGQTKKDVLFATSTKASSSGSKSGSEPVSLDVRDYSLFDNQGQSQSENDLLFRRPGPHYTTSKEGKNLSNLVPTSAVLPNKPMQFSSMQRTVHDVDLSENKVAQTAEIPSSGVTAPPKLRRANSFSGQVRPAQDLKDSTTPGGSQGKASRTRTSSFSSSTADTLEAYSAEVVVPTVIWVYMKDCYSTQIKNLTTGLNVKECKSGRNSILYLTGADLPTVDLCQQELQNQIAIVTTDFCAQDLPLAMLGVTNPKDETLQLSCLELQSKLEKVKIVLVSKTIIILGPSKLCEQVVTKLTEVFHSDTQRKKEMQESLDGSSPISLLPGHIPEMPADKMKDPKNASGAHSLLKDDIPQITRSVHNPQYSRYTQMDRELESNRRKHDPHWEDSSQKEKKHDYGTTMNGGNGGIESAEQNDSMFKHKLGLDLSISREKLESDTSLTHTTGADQRVTVLKDSGSMSLPYFAYTVEKTEAPNEEINPPGPDCLASAERKDLKDQGAIVSGKIPGKTKTQEDDVSCLCGTRRSSISRMACGNAYCAQCVCDHASCKVCPKAEDVRGIKGTISFSEMVMNLPGHMKDTTLKVTYNIPDGVQGDDHPNPGAPFKGGVFEAFLPLNKQTKRLVLLLNRAFDVGQTFTVAEGPKGEMVAWGNIPHKTKMNGGRSQNGYPDSSYIKRLTEALKHLDIKEDGDTSKVKDKIKS